MSEFLMPLYAENFRCILIDFLGNGQSDRVENFSPDMWHIDSFISHRNQKSDLEKVRQIGIEAYNAEQEEKVEILGVLLAGYNDGRKKTLSCVAVNLLKIHELREVLGKIENRSDLENLTLKEKALLLHGC